MNNQNGYEQEDFTHGHPVKSDPRALTALNLAKLTIEHDEIDFAAEDAEFEPSCANGLSTSFEEDIKAGKKIINWFSKLETPGHNNPNMCSPDYTDVYQGGLDDISSQASVAGVKTGYYPFEASNDDKVEPTYGRENMTAHDTCLIIYDMHQWKQDMDEKPMGWQRPMQTRVQSQMQVQTPTPVQTPTHVSVHRPSPNLRPRSVRNFHWDELGKCRRDAAPK
ncbi:hypothetical protein LTR70_007546 [Exophiala xenobiotica]|uniref:Uncharacterized protein n=1 Tax=Lithohypha guttulata TaxID=1690604 RepID=A0ABR0K7C3_9EURO|nr:hypothetical protein LTR24_005987 [Lithohypha guttulata]KAK5313562.1 hypothetical protein LTR70_007546 [Exophiala xenobiotica]